MPKLRKSLPPLPEMESPGLSRTESIDISPFQAWGWNESIYSISQLKLLEPLKVEVRCFPLMTLIGIQKSINKVPSQPDHLHHLPSTSKLFILLVPRPL